MPEEGLEPTHCCQYWILSPARLPFRHSGFANVVGAYRVFGTSQFALKKMYSTGRCFVITDRP